MAGGPNDAMKDLIPFDYAKLKANATNLARKRGETEAQWEDIWAAFARDVRGGELLRELGVDTAELQYDLMFSQIYGRPAPFVNPADLQRAKLEIAQELAAEVKRFIEETEEQHQTQDPYAQDAALEKLRGQLMDHASALTMQATSESDNVKAASFLTLANQFLAWQQRRGSSMHDVYVVKATMEEFLQFVMAKTPQITSTPPLELLEQAIGLQGNQADAHQLEMNVSLVLQHLRNASGGYYDYLLARNGLVMPQHYEAPCTLQPRSVAKQALQAYQLVDEERGASVEPMHLARILLASHDVQAGLRELLQQEAQGADDTLSPEKRQVAAERMVDVLQSIRQQTKPRSAAREQFRKHISVSPEVSNLMKAFADLPPSDHDVPSTVRLFGQLLVQPDVMQLLVNAGISAETMATWNEAQERFYERQNVLKKKDDDQGLGDDPSRFKIPDEALEGMLQLYGRDLTKMAAEGKLDPVIGRAEEMEQMKEILLRKGKRNVVLLGEAGVGKTALFEGFAQQVINGSVPQKLLGARVVEIDLQGMNAGAMFRGQFEERLKTIVDGVAERNASGKFPPIILCIDELHAAMHAGTASGTPGASEMLKPALTRGTLLTLGATTEREYRQHVAKDAALTRRFEPVVVPEPAMADRMEILQGVLPVMQAHHGVEIPATLLDELTRLTARYVQGFSPDKDIAILDMACAKAAKANLPTLQRDQLLESVAQKGRLPIDFLKRDDNEKSLMLPQVLREHVIAQEQATDKVATAVIKAKAGLQEPGKPIASFLFQGPTGVGKTETAKALALNEFGSEDALVRIDMGEFAEPHSVSRLIGAPPGYIGHDEEGQLTGAVSRRPHSVILLDEVEKAHPKVFDALLALLDDGRMTDGQGRTIDFRNTIIIMTTNHPDPKKLFRPEMFNRIDAVVQYNSLPLQVVDRLVQRQLDKLEGRMKEQFGCELEVSPHALAQLAERGYQPEYGARPLIRAVDQHVTGQIAPWLLRHQAEVKGKVIRINDIDAFAPEIADAKSADAQNAADAPGSTVQGAASQGRAEPKKPREK